MSLSSQNGFGTNSCVANLTAGFIDLATYDELEKYMYGGPDATAYFVRETRKSTWFTQCPVTLARCNGSPEFGSEWSCSISRAGDYLLGTWLHVITPAVSVAPSSSSGVSVCISWAPNFMHALVKECCITFNDLVAARFDGTHLDFWAAFTTPASKTAGYAKMIGAQLPTMGTHIEPQRLNLPLPFFYSRDSGVALPTAALPYNEMRISFVFRDWRELICVFYNAAPVANLDFENGQSSTVGATDAPTVNNAFHNPSNVLGASAFCIPGGVAAGGAGCRLAKVVHKFVQAGGLALVLGELLGKLVGRGFDGLEGAGGGHGDFRDIHTACCQGLADIDQLIRAVSTNHSDHAGGFHFGDNGLTT